MIPARLLRVDTRHSCGRRSPTRCTVTRENWDAEQEEHGRAMLALWARFAPNLAEEGDGPGRIHALAAGYRAQPAEHAPRRSPRRVVVARAGRLQPAFSRGRPISDALSTASICVVGQPIREAISPACAVTMPPRYSPPTWAWTSGGIHRGLSVHGPDNESAVFLQVEAVPAAGAHPSGRRLRWARSDRLGLTLMDWPT